MKQCGIVTTAIFLLICFAFAAGCTPDPTDTPDLWQMHPDPFSPPTHARGVHFLIENGKLCPDGAYCYFYIGEEVILVDDIDGEWTFRCPFGYHYIYRLQDPEEFFYSHGDPPYDVYVQCFNAGENGEPEYGEGDDIPSNIISWRIEE